MHTLALIVALCANAGANILIKAAGRHAGPEGGLVAQFLGWRFLVGVSLFGLALAFYTVALRRIDLAVGYPVMTGGGLLIVATASALLFQEQLGPLRLAGMALIVVGAVLVLR